MEKIKQLRELTGAGMVDCKKALEESGNDLDKAVEILRKKGIAKAAKRSDRDASEGIVKVATNDEATEGYIVEINSETDFVARNEQFQKFTDDVIALVKEKKPADLEALFELEMEGGKVKEVLDSMSGVIGEKLGIKQFEVLKTEGSLSAYSHMGGKIGVLVSIDQKDKADLAYDIAMQIAAANPRYLAPEDVPEDDINKEKEIYKEQLLKEGKPENIIDKIMEGKINKYYEEICLVKQEFIKEDKKKVEEILGESKIEKFIRYSL